MDPTLREDSEVFVRDQGGFRNKGEYILLSVSTSFFHVYLNCVSTLAWSRLRTQLSNPCMKTCVQTQYSQVYLSNSYSVL